MAEIENDAERLQALIDEVNRKAAHDELRPYEVALFREMLPQLREMLEAHRRQQWIAKRIGMFLLGVPAAMAMWQAVAKLVEWIKGQ